jgi:hypothetical protein
VEPPRPSGSGYEFEYAVQVVSRDGTQTTNFIDLHKAGHFPLEAKDEEPGPSPDLDAVRVPIARRASVASLRPSSHQMRTWVSSSRFTWGPRTRGSRRRAARRNPPSRSLGNH